MLQPITLQLSRTLSADGLRGTRRACCANGRDGVHDHVRASGRDRAVAGSDPSLPYKTSTYRMAVMMMSSSEHSDQIDAQTSEGDQQKLIGVHFRRVDKPLYRLEHDEDRN